jgi:hypothetical protein
MIRYWLKALWCWLRTRHDYKWTRNLYGDQIIAHNWKRSIWNCANCNWPDFRDGLREEPKRKPTIAGRKFTVEEPLGPF